MIKPLGKNVLIEPIPEEKVSAGGLYLPNGQKSGVLRATVRGVAKGVAGVEENDTILYEAHAPTVDAGEGRRIVSVDYIAAVLA